MLTKLLENKWTVMAVVLALMAIYYFYQNQTSH